VASRPPRSGRTCSGKRRGGRTPSSRSMTRCGPSRSPSNLSDATDTVMRRARSGPPAWLAAGAASRSGGRSEGPRETGGRLGGGGGTSMGRPEPSWAQALRRARRGQDARPAAVRLQPAGLRAGGAPAKLPARVAVPGRSGPGGARRNGRLGRPLRLAGERRASVSGSADAPRVPGAVTVRPSASQPPPPSSQAARSRARGIAPSTRGRVTSRGETEGHAPLPSAARRRNLERPIPKRLVGHVASAPVSLYPGRLRRLKNKVTREDLAVDLGHARNGRCTDVAAARGLWMTLRPWEA